jgi:subtilisin family serine protease
MFDRDALQSDGFSWKSALSLALASQLAYVRSSQGVIQVAKDNWGFTGCLPFAAGDTQGFVAWDEACVLVSYRGTESIGDWLLNVSLAPTERPYGRAHRGFSSGFETVRVLVEDAVQQAGVGGKRLWLTGHSLGGALATITAAEWVDRHAVTGVYTYGQPKSVGARPARLFRQRYEGRFHRFVNDDDIVPGVPPGYRHVGRLYWFDARGGLQAFDADTESLEASNQPNELSEEELDELQARLHDLKKETEKSITAGQAGLEGATGAEGLAAARQTVFDASVEGLVPGVRDHAIERYITQIRRQLTRPVEVDEALAQAITGGQGASLGLERGEAVELEGGSRRSKLGALATVPVLIRVRDPAWKAPPGVRVQSRLGNIVSASAPLRILEELRSDKGIVSIDSSREGGILELETSKQFVHATAVHQPPIDEKGDSAIVGIIDSGVDVLHEVFLDDGGKTRILCVWDQRASSGNAPSAAHADVFSQSYGTLYLQSEIQDMVDHGIAPAALRDPLCHGTHVASIAAGRPVGSFAGGIAPEAKLIVVIPDMKTAPGDPPSLGYSNSHVDALSFIQSAAAREGLPVAVNVSLGMNAGAHDGSSTLEAAFDAFTGMGRLPGVVLVKSAGNERGHKGHASVEVPQNGFADISWESCPVRRDEDYIEVWFNAFDDIEFTLMDPSGNAAAAVSATNPEVDATLNGNFCRLRLTLNHRDNGDNLLLVTIESDGSPIQGGLWTLRLLGKTILSPGAGVVHAWVERHDSRAVAFNSGDNDEMTLSIPGTANHVITVAACGSAMPLHLTSSSSWGLTRDRRPKPDLVAPGTAVVAAQANTGSHRATVAMTGTSMAAPHVTGSIALVLSKRHKEVGKPQVNAVQIRKELIASAQNFTGVHNKGVGYGALDTLAFVNRF